MRKDTKVTGWFNLASCMPIVWAEFPVKVFFLFKVKPQHRNPVKLPLMTFGSFLKYYFLIIHGFVFFEKQRPSRNK